MPSMTRRPSPAALAAARVSFGGMGQGGPEGEVAVGPRPNLRRGEGAVAVARATEGAGGGVGGVAPFVLLLLFFKPLVWVQLLVHPSYTRTPHSHIHRLCPF